MREEQPSDHARRILAGHYVNPIAIGRIGAPENPGDWAVQDIQAL